MFSALSILLVPETKWARLRDYFSSTAHARIAGHSLPVSVLVFGVFPSETKRSWTFSHERKRRALTSLRNKSNSNRKQQQQRRRRRQQQPQLRLRLRRLVLVLDRTTRTTATTTTTTTTATATATATTPTTTTTAAITALSYNNSKKAKRPRKPRSSSGAPVSEHWIQEYQGLRVENFRDMSPVHSIGTWEKITKRTKKGKPNKNKQKHTSGKQAKNVKKNQQKRNNKNLSTETSVLYRCPTMFPEIVLSLRVGNGLLKWSALQFFCSVSKVFLDFTRFLYWVNENKKVIRGCTFFFAARLSYAREKRKPTKK